MAKCGKAFAATPCAVGFGEAHCRSLGFAPTAGRGRRDDKVEDGVCLCAVMGDGERVQVAQRGRSKAMSGRQKSVQVYVDTAAAPGRCSWERCMRKADGSQETFSFEYDQQWLEGGHGRGAHYPAQSRNNFGLFLDSSPDRWGRVLMQRG